jgi:hypothetical protein
MFMDRHKGSTLSVVIQGTFPRVSNERLQMFQPPILVPREPRIIICVKCLPLCPKYFLLLILGCDLCLSKCYALGVDLVSICMTIAFSIFVSACASQRGPFEQRGLQTLWSNGSAAVRELLADGKIRQAYTTMMTTMDRLYKKGLLDRIAEGRALRYTPRHAPEELQRVDSAGEHPAVADLG